MSTMPEDGRQGRVMPNNATFTWIIAILVTLGICGCSGDASRNATAQKLIGFWQTENSRLEDAPTNFICEGFRTIEFRRDGWFKTYEVVTVNGERRTNSRYSGTYAVADTNLFKIDRIVIDESRPPVRISGVRRFWFVGDELAMPDEVSHGMPWERANYRRVN